MSKYFILRWFLCPIIRLYIKEIKGLQNFPKEGNYIFAANHNSLADDFAFICLYGSRRKENKLCAIARQKPIKKTFIDKTIMRIIAYLTNLLVIIINSHEENKIQKVLNLIKKGYCFFNHPEGRVNTDTKVMLKARTGTARIALLSRKPIIPIGLIDTEKVLPLNSHFPRFHRMTINIGEPINLDKYYGQEDNKDILEKITHSYMKEIGSLSGKKYPY